MFEAVSGTSPEVAGVLLKKLDNTSGRVAVIKEIARVCIPDEVETGRVLDLCVRVNEVRQERNRIVHSANLGFDKRTGEVHQIVNRSGKVMRLTDKTFALLINRMYLLIDAMIGRRFREDGWHEPLDHWKRPHEFLDQLDQP